MEEDRFVAQLAGRVLAAPGASVVLAQWQDPGGGQDPPLYIAPLHIHHDDDEAWYVLEGALAVRLGEQNYELGPGGAICAPRGTAHTYWNPRPEPTRYLLVMTPRISQLIDALHEMTERTPERMAATFERYESEWLGWP